MKSHSLKPFDDGKYLSEEEALKLIETIPIPKDEPETVLESRIIDLTPAANGKVKTQDVWVAYFNARKEVMVSTPDLYRAGRTNNQGLLNSLRKDFSEKWLVTSTRIKYEDIQQTIITHNYGSNLVQPVEHRIVVPSYQRRILTDVVDTNEGLTYLQSLFGTEDDANLIKQTLQNLSNYSPDQINVWSANLSRRPIEDVSGFGYFEDRFNVCGSANLLHVSGRSHAVHINITPKSGGAP